VCCIQGQCSILTLFQCIAAGGSFNSLLGNCTPNPCPTTTTSTIGTSTTSTTTSTTTTTTQVGGAFLEFTTGTPGGTCGNTLDDTGTLIKNLTCGGLNIGGSASIIDEGPTPDGSISLFALTCAAGGACDQTCAGSLCNIGPTSVAPPLNSTAPDCTTTGCNFGTPLPIPNPSQPSLSICELNTWASPASGTVNISTGQSQTAVRLLSDVYITGNGTQPCPKCSAVSPATGTCDRGPRAGSTCTSTSSTGYTRDCPTGGVGTQTSPCPGGQIGNGGCCGPVCSDNFTIPCADPTLDCVTPGSHCVANVCTNSATTECTIDANCPAGGTCLPHCNCPCTTGGGNCCDGSHLNVIPIDLSPLGTTGASATNASGIFCTSQVHAGCFGSSACRTISETGSSGGTLVTNVPASATLASVFCIPATGNAVVDAPADLPGPGAVSLPGTYEAHN